jgi:hypothetical protein
MGLLRITALIIVAFVVAVDSADIPKNVRT